MNEKKTSSEEWNFEVDQGKVQELEEEREKERKKQRKTRKKIIAVEKVKVGNEKAKDEVYDELQDKHVQTEKAKRRQRELSELAPSYKRFLAYLIDVIFATLLVGAIFFTGFTPLAVKEIKYYSNMAIDYYEKNSIKEAVSPIKKKVKENKYIVMVKAQIQKIGLTNVHSMIFYAVFYFLIFIFSVMIWGKSPGKRIVGIQIVTFEGEMIKWKTGFYRETIGKFLLLWGAVAILFTRNRQALYDKLFHTKVVNYDARLFTGKKKGYVA